MVLMKVVQRAQFTASRQPSVVTFLKRESLKKTLGLRFFQRAIKPEPRVGQTRWNRTERTGGNNEKHQGNGDPTSSSWKSPNLPFSWPWKEEESPRESKPLDFTTKKERKKKLCQ
jgi:hypothetical protein